ncbi:hypothetical protein JRI60_34375 [Archangium violaceum]|uniref:hypothetical protein n=1 Tax=Archangium violaceum TaxID=83451 RepID=UPI00194E8B3D|nr:hypothetical protein [Archangium violaceum]QRN94203.1 hypothetical protein JRI60_34375 [Archangium violaceum]
MDLTAISDASDKRRWLVLAGLAAVPVYVLPVGLWGTRALWPRVLREAARGAVALGMLSLIGIAIGRFARVEGKQPTGGDRWKLPHFGPIMSDEFAASAASGH